MNHQAIEVYDYQGGIQAGYSPNSLQSLGGLAQQSGGYYVPQIPVCRPSARELTIQWLATGKVYLDYGEDLRLLMAEPVKGMKLREAIQLLREALCHNLDPHQ